MIYTQQKSEALQERKLTWTHWFAFINLIISIFIASLYAISVPLPDSIIGNVYLLTNWLGHMSFLTFVFFVVLILPVCYLNTSTRFLRAWAALIAATGVAMLAIDSLFYIQTGFHMSTNDADALRQQASEAAQQVSLQYIGYLIVMLIVWLSLQLAIANALWKRLDRLRAIRGIRLAPTIFVVCFCVSHTLHMWADAKFYRPILQQDDMFPLSYPLTAKTMMANYGLMDLQQHKQQRNLQFDTTITDTQYPLSPVYCAINDAPITLLMVSEWPEETSPLVTALTSYTSHYDMASTEIGSVFNTLYSVPELYMDAFNKRLPLFVDLPHQLGFTVNLYQHKALLNQSILNGFNVSYDSFKQTIGQQKNLSIGVISWAELIQLLPTVKAEQGTVVITSIAPQQQAKLYTNLPIQTGDKHLSQHMDIVPSILWEAGCKADARHYSVGKNVINNQQMWMINSHSEGAVLQTADMRLVIYQNGYHSASSLDGNPKTLSVLPIKELKQGMARLTQFVKPRP